MIHKNYVNSVREEFSYLLKNEIFQVDKNGGKMLEIRSATFIADERSIFGEVNQSYVDREIAWYESRSTNVNDIPGGPPEIWKSVADPDGLINSNYGYRIYDGSTGDQFGHVVKELRNNPDSRRAVMIYTHPWIWTTYNWNGRSDFICTNAVQYFNRYGNISADVQMRSNDAVFGYKNDLAWQKHVLAKVAAELKAGLGSISWHAGSLHVYERHFYLVHHYGKTGDHMIEKKRYKELYHDSPWNDKPKVAPEVSGAGETHSLVE